MILEGLASLDAVVTCLIRTGASAAGDFKREQTIETRFPILFRAAITALNHG